MITQYFTFGQSHKHPHTGESMRNVVIEIKAPTKQAAREIMFERYGRKWSHQYDEIPTGPYPPYKIYETITVYPTLSVDPDADKYYIQVQGYDPPLEASMSNNSSKTEEAYDKG